MQMNCILLVGMVCLDTDADLIGLMEVMCGNSILSLDYGHGLGEPQITFLWQELLLEEILISIRGLLGIVLLVELELTVFCG